MSPNIGYGYLQYLEYESHTPNIGVWEMEKNVDNSYSKNWSIGFYPYSKIWSIDIQKSE